MKIRFNSRNYWKGISGIVLAFLTSGVLIAGGEEHTMDLSEMDGSGSTIKRTSIPDGESVSVSDGDTLVVKSEGTDFSYDITEIRAKAGITFTIRYENSSNMPHNMVLVTSRSDINPVGTAALRSAKT